MYFIITLIGNMVDFVYNFTIVWFCGVRINYTYDMVLDPVYSLRQIVCLWNIFSKYLMTDVLQPMGFQKSTLVARDADTQLGSSCISARLATNVELFACFGKLC